MSSFGSTTEDLDGAPIDRGPPEEDRRTMAELRGAMRDIASAQKSLGKTATVKGLATEVEVIKQQLEMTHEQMRRVIGLYGTLQEQFRQFQAQRVIELQSWIGKNGGSTTPEDHGDNA